MILIINRLKGINNFTLKHKINNSLEKCLINQRFIQIFPEIRIMLINILQHKIQNKIMV
jgi:hypothetical protein